MIYEIIVQGIGFIGLALNVISFQSNKHKNIVVMKTGCELSFAVQYLLMGAYTGMVLDGISAIRNVIFIKLVKKGKSTTPYIIFFSALTIACCIAVWLTAGWDGPISFLVIIAKVLTSIAYGMKNTAKIRALAFPSSALWCVYNSYCFSIAGILTEVFTMSSIVIAAVRFRKTRQPDSNENTDTKVSEETLIKTDSYQSPAAEGSSEITYPTAENIK